MIKAFYPETKPLSVKEKKAARIVYLALEITFGKKNALKNSALQKIIIDKSGGSLKMDDSRVRKIISFIRREGHIINLIAGSTGYYRTGDHAELMDYCKGLEDRGSADFHLAATIRQLNGFPPRTSKIPA